MPLVLGLVSGDRAVQAWGFSKNADYLVHASPAMLSPSRPSPFTETPGHYILSAWRGQRRGRTVREFACGPTPLHQCAYNTSAPTLTTCASAGAGASGYFRVQVYVAGGGGVAAVPGRCGELREGGTTLAGSPATRTAAAQARYFPPPAASSLRTPSRGQWLPHVRTAGAQHLGRG